LAPTIFRRAERARRRRTRIWAGIAGFCLLLAILATSSSVYAWHELTTNKAFLNATLKTATDIVNTAVAQAERYNVPRAATLELLSRAEVLFDNMAQFGQPTPELQYQKAWMLIQFARNYAILGDTGKERAHAEEAHSLLAKLAAAKPNDTTYQNALSAAYIEVGVVQEARGNLAGALKSYRDSLAIRERLAQSDPGNAEWQLDLSRAYERVGDVQTAQGDTAGALKSFRNSLAIRERLAQSDPGNADWQRSLSVAYGRVGDVQMAQGDLASALKSYRDSLAIQERLAQSDPSNARWQRDVALSYEKVGDVQVAQGDLASALKSHGAELAINKLWHDNLHDAAAGFGGLAFKLVLAHDMTNALAAADQSISLAPDQIWLYTNRAHALMFLGRIDEARALYLKYRGQKDASSDAKPWETIVLGDFAEFRNAGLTNPLMDEIEKLFTSAG
jgi:tetratricopeptide (TPR) repeat protein